MPVAERSIGVYTFLLGGLDGADLRPGSTAPELHRLRGVIDAHGGRLFKTQPRSWFAVFDRAESALAAALAIQTDPPAARTSKRHRIALHAGPAEHRAGDFFGPPLNRAARMLAIAHPGQVLISEAARGLLEASLPPGCRLASLGEHRLKDLLNLEALYQLEAEGLTSEFPPPQSLDLSPNNLPIQLTEFVGREADMHTASCRLQHAPLLTLVGEGGVGKSRLALHLAAELIERFPAGAWLVDLSPLSTEDSIGASIARTLEIAEQPGRSIEDSLLEALSARPVLLILDNCEHLIEATAGLVARILHAAPTTRVLATSREALSIPGESLLRLSGLELPSPRDVGPVPNRKLTSSGAVRLFVNRARAIQVGFDPSPHVEDIIELVRALDGNPLAIELAAARAGVLTPGQIRQRLSDRFLLLTTGDPTASPHHRTLKATLDWSYALLDEGEQILFQRLATFRGGCDLELAEALCGGDHIPPETVLGLLAGLVRKSLVVSDVRRTETRFRMLETIRHYADRKLAESGEADHLRDRLASVLLERAMAMADTTADLERDRQLARLAADHDNICFALEWCNDRDEQRALGLRLATALGLYWYQRCHYRDGRRWLVERLDQLEKAGLDRSEQAWAHYMASLCLMGAASYEEQSAVLVRAIEHFEAAGESRGLGWAFNDLGLLQMNQGRPDDALHSYTLSAEHKRALGDAGDLAITLSNMGEAFCSLGRLEEGRDRFQEAATTHRRLGGSVYLTDVAYNLGDLALGRSDLGEAEQLFRESLEVAMRYDERYMAAKAIIGFARLARARGSSEQAAALFGTAEAELESLGTSLEAYARPGYARDREACKSQLSEAAWNAAKDAGRSRALEDIAPGLLRDGEEPASPDGDRR